MSLRTHRGKWHITGKMTKVGREDSSTLGAIAQSVYDEEITLATGGAVTTISDIAPAGALITAICAKITTTIAGLASDTTVAVKIGDAAILSFGTTRTAGTSTSTMAANTIPDGFTMTITCAGDGDKIPSAGKVRLFIQYETVGDI